MKAPKKWAGFRSILCPVDLSEPSRLALRYAQAIARRSDASLHVAYVNDSLLVAAAAAALHDRGIARRSARELQTFVNETLSSTGRQRALYVSTGDPVTEIVKSTRSRRADLIVMGTHGLTGADRILAAVDLNGRAADDVDVAVRVADAFGCSLLLLNSALSHAGATMSVRMQDRRHLASAQQQMEALAARARRHADIDVCVLHGRIGEKLAALADVERVQLVVTALRERHRWFGPKRGSISYQVLSHASVPVLA